MKAIVRRAKGTREERFHQYAAPLPGMGPNDCWLWRGYRNDFGYGMMRTGAGGPLERAHRLMWEFAYGYAPIGLEVCHTCDNPGCVNPRHLFVGSHWANMQDRNRKGRVVRPPGEIRHHIPRGEETGRAKLTAEKVRAIRSRRAAGESARALANEYGLTQQHVIGICARRSWAHVD